MSRGKAHPQAITAITRELLGFMWAINMQLERERDTDRVRAA